MARIHKYPNQGTLRKGEPCSFLCFENISPLFIPNLSLLGLTIGLSIRFFSTTVVYNDLDSYQENQVEDNPLLSSPSKYYPPPLSSSAKSASTSSQESQKNIKRKSKKKKLGHGGMEPTIADQVGGISVATASHASSTNTIQKPKKIGCKLKFPCKLCKGDHLTYLCLVLPNVGRV